MTFGTVLLSWYEANKRDLPWRHTSDPYKIWLSEIILQQTRVDQGLNYYLKFIHAFPVVKKLAEAKEDEVLKLWQGLGYYSRARNLHSAAKDIMNRFGGKFPCSYDDIITLKGVGEYTAAAVASFAYNEKKPVVDGNVYRFLARYLGIKTAVNTTKARKEFTEAAMELMADCSPHDFNQAIMEFGALQCKPQNPDCMRCPFNDHCYAFAKKKVEVLPVKDKKISIRTRYFNYLCIGTGENIHVRKRTHNDIWKNMYDFPLIETKNKIALGKLTSHPEFKKYISGKRYFIVSASGLIKHQLSHQTIYARFYLIDTIHKPDVPGIKAMKKSRLNTLALPRLIERYLESQAV